MSSMTSSGHRFVTEADVRWKAVRSGGPGGQNVSRRSTKVEAWVCVENLPLDGVQKKLIRERLAHHINHRDELWIENSEERSQERNKEKALVHLNALIAEALYVPLPRIPTEPSRGSEEARIREKKIISRKKQSRRHGM